jgi:protein gp37
VRVDGGADGGKAGAVLAEALEELNDVAGVELLGKRRRLPRACGVVEDRDRKAQAEAEAEADPAPKPNPEQVEAMLARLSAYSADEVALLYTTGSSRTPNLDWLILTKRAGRIAAKLPQDWGDGWPNVWLGVSIENHEFAWRADALRNIPAVVRFISYEPALGPLDELSLEGIDWVIFGGELGPGYRAMDLQWASDMRDRCAAAGVAFFLKQVSGPRNGMGEDALGQVIHEYPTPRALPHPRPAMPEDA